MSQTQTKTPATDTLCLWLRQSGGKRRWLFIAHGTAEQCEAAKQAYVIGKRWKAFDSYVGVNDPNNTKGKQ